MSIATRNRIRGAACDVYRPLPLEGTGGQTLTVFCLLLSAERLELLPVTDEIAREIFGLDERVECSVLVSAARGIAQGDGIAVTTGPHAGRRFRVLATRQLGDYRRGWVECALALTTEAFEPEAG